MFGALIAGFGLGASLIIAIGAQNAFVMRQGLRGVYPFLTAAICAACDAVLIALGVAGVGSVIAGSDFLTTAATVGGVLFLGYYGIRSFRSALKPAALNPDDVQTPIPTTRRQTIFAALGFSLLNPHVYLDTVVLLGGIGANRPPDERPFFALGAMLASLTWFFSLSYGAARLAPLFRNPRTWRVLDVVIGCIMWLIAASLLMNLSD